MGIHHKWFFIGFVSVQLALQAAYGQASQTDGALADGALVESEQAAATSTLEGSNWQLVKITVAGGYEFIPADRSKYALNFRSENRLTGTSDCNQISGTWHQEGAALQFDPFAASRSLCEPGSLHNTLVLNLRGVQAMTIEQGHLILTTSTAGVVLEFESRD